MDKINIRGLSVHCIIGTKPVERVSRQQVVMNIALECDFSEASKSDNIDDTVNYKDLKDEIVVMAEGSSYLLLEKLAEEVASICLKPERVQSVSLTVEKPSALTGADSVGVEIVRPRQ